MTGGKPAVEGLGVLVADRVARPDRMETIGTQKQINTIMFVCHPDDESIFGASALGPSTYVIVVTDANSGGTGAKRRAYLARAMSIAQSPWEMWDFPETMYEGPLAQNGWNSSTREDLVDKIREKIMGFKCLERVVTHNKYGEYALRSSESTRRLSRHMKVCKHRSNFLEGPAMSSCNFGLQQHADR